MLPASLCLLLLLLALTNSVSRVAKPHADEKVLQADLDFCSGPGGVDCTELVDRGACFDLNNLHAHDFKGTGLVTISDPKPVFTSVTSFAPATIANLGPGFDFLGCAVDGIGDHITLQVDPDVQPGHISISAITGVGNSSTKLTKDPLWNCAGIAAISVMKMLGIRSVGLSLSLEKGLPLGSGLGSSAASAVAAAVAVNELFGKKLSISELVLAGLESEAKVSGYHADNIAPAIMGGFVLISSMEPLDLVQLSFPIEKDLFFVLVSPEFEAPTKKMRQILPSEVRMTDHNWNSAQAGVLIASILKGDINGLGKAMSSDKIVEPKRAPLIPGFIGVKRAALQAGAFGCTISGAGPTAVAVIDNEEKGKEIGEKMVEAFMKEGNLKASATVRSLDRVGARLVSRSSGAVILNGEEMGEGGGVTLHPARDARPCESQGDGGSNPPPSPVSSPPSITRSSEQ